MCGAGMFKTSDTLDSFVTLRASETWCRATLFSEQGLKNTCSFYTPLKWICSHRQHHDLQVAAQAIGTADPWCCKAEDRRWWSSLFRIIWSLLLFTLLMAFSGSVRHWARMSVPRFDSSILHCWMMEVDRRPQLQETWKLDYWWCLCL